MHPFSLSSADDPAKAIAAHAQDGRVAFIAGGTDLLGLMKDHATFPERLLDINRLPGMSRIEARPDGGLRIGALARMSDVAADPQVRQRFPVIAEGLLFAASGQLRNMAMPRAISAGLAPVALPSTVSIATMRSSAGPMPALPHIHRTWQWHSRPWMPL